MGPNPMTDTLARREDTAAQKHTGECHVMAKAETGMMTLQVDTWIPDCQPLGLRDNTTVGFSHPVCYGSAQTNIRSIQYIPTILVCELRENV